MLKRSQTPPLSDNGQIEAVSDFGPNRQSPEEVQKVDAAPNPFDVDQLRLAQTDPAAIGVQELLVNVAYKKPPRDAFFRVHPSPEYSVTIGTLELSGRDEVYYVGPSLWGALSTEKTFGRRLVHTCVTAQGEPFLWGCRMPGLDGKQPPWVTIPLEAAREAKTQWVRLFWDNDQRKHRILTAKNQRDEPQWPEKSLSDLLRLAFADMLILDMDHPVLKRLRGEL
jgi:hypothetical protein